jgi:hypothetical protein
MLDYFGVRSEEFQFVLKTLASYPVDRLSSEFSSSSQIPNFAFSAALCCFQLECSGVSEEHIRTLLSACPEWSTAASPLSESLCANAIRSFPEVPKQLIHKLKDSSCDWKLLGSFPDNFSACAGVKKLVDIYVERMHLLWKSDRVLLWLHRVCVQVSATPFPPRPDLPLSAFDRFCRLISNDFSDNVTVLPQEDLQAQAAIEAIDRPSLFESSNPLMAFLMSLMPWIDATGHVQGDVQ